MNADFFEAIEDIEKEKGIPRGYMYDKIRQAMLVTTPSARTMWRLSLRKRTSALR